ncbi:MAG TPA: LacI family transcriptional regulator [Alphaproteobacteria bacterium]|nr:LacI family transcriptional regulator [Alphaproteobacteria bacterium]
MSAATVSRVLSTPERVSEAARQRVFDAVRETGYTLNQAARSLRRRQAKTILVALPNIGNPFYSTILQAVITTASARGYSVLVAARLGEDPNRWLSDYLLSNRADGLLLFDGSLDTRSLHEIIPDGEALPLVAAYDELPDPQINSVLTDNRAAAHRVVRHLTDYGHTRIGHVAGPSRTSAPNERLVGFREAMTAAGLELRPEWIIPGDYTMEGGVAAAERLAALAERPSAVFVANDEMAIGFISRMRELGIECPRDISVVGFDDIAVARHFAPPLTTMRQPREQIGRLATDTVINIIEGTAGPDPIHIVLSSQLIIRASTARFVGGVWRPRQESNLRPIA